MKPKYTGVISKTLWLECRGEEKEGILACASVIWNRSIIRKLSLEEVCLEPLQFSCWDKKPKSYALTFIPRPITKKELEVLQLIQQIEEQMLNGMFFPIAGYTHYHSVNCSPSWSNTMTDVKYIGRHKFGITK